MHYFLKQPGYRYIIYNISLKDKLIVIYIGRNITDDILHTVFNLNKMLLPSSVRDVLVFILQT